MYNNNNINTNYNNNCYKNNKTKHKKCLNDLFQALDNFRRFYLKALNIRVPLLISQH